MNIEMTVTYGQGFLLSYTNNMRDDVIMLIVTIKSDKAQGAL
jgi:hypothetical protein